MCGIIAIVGQGSVNQALYDGLTILQHRGQDAAGIATSAENRLYLRKANGLVKDVFRTRHMQKLEGNSGLGHCRYPTAGSSAASEAQPFYVNSPFGIALAHNGNLVNADELRDDLYREDRRHLNTNSDSEILLNVFAHELLRHIPAGIAKLPPEAVFKAIEGVYKRCSGGFAVVALIMGFGIVSFRDAHGIRPLIRGIRHTETGAEHIIASESVALDGLGFDVVDDIHPGQAVLVEFDGKVHKKQCAKESAYAPCIFEHVYFARPDSMIDGISVYKTRLRMGDALARKIKQNLPVDDIDVVIPIPDTSRTSAIQLSYHLGVPYREGFIKNRYIGRTFIMPGQEERKKSVRQKLNSISLEFRDKNVLLVDDSIVRGTTSSQIVAMARESGANKVYFASAAPPVRYPNVYGIDMPTASELVANGRSAEEVGQLIGADRLWYQDLEDLVECATAGNPDIKNFDTSCFNKQYVTGDVSEQYLKALEQARNDGAKKLRIIDGSIEEDSDESDLEIVA
ncbi:MAG: amidophosphoribosyltransferase [Proteobacteria bacterium]|jgi:amidophosphoribosyltransferase|nr:amidophosphoribosyltransferase [Pseudomonadota bacterium]